MTSSSVLLSVRNLSKVFKFEKGETLVFKNLSFDIHRGERLALLGPNGCGKSTLLRILAGVLSADEGDVDYMSEGRPARFPEVGIVFQSPRLLPWLTVEQNIRLPLDLCKQLNIADFQSQLVKHLKMADLSDKVNLYPHQLSGGLSQRVAILRGLVAQPQVLLLDEPFNNLDCEIHESLRDFIKEIHGAIDAAIVLVTHDENDAKYICDRVIKLSRRPAVISSVEDILQVHERTMTSGSA